MIKITKGLLSRWFDEVNNEFFNNELRKPDFVITHNRGYFGQFRPRTWTIEISIYWIRSERDYMNTLIHECCHCYVRQKYGYRVQSHGYEWKEVADRINRQMCGKYGTIQRCGGGQDNDVVRYVNAEKFIVFTDYHGKIGIAKYRDDAYVARLKKMGCVMGGTKMYYLVSDNADLAKVKFRKVNTISIRWQYIRLSLSEILDKSSIIKTEMYGNLKKVA